MAFFKFSQIVGRKLKCRSRGEKSLENICVCVCIHIYACIHICVYTYMHACMCVQSCSTLCDPMDCNQPTSTVHGISQSRILEWVAISYSRGSSQLRDQTHLSSSSYLGFFMICITWEIYTYVYTSVQSLCCVQLFATPWTAAHQAPRAQTHVHWDSDTIQPTHPLLSPSPPAFNLSQHQGLF